MKLLFVVNPISGGKNKENFLEQSKAYCHKYGLETIFFNTTGEDDVTKLKGKIAESNPDRVVSIGGDGTTLMTSLALQGSDVPFGIIPMGSANGMAKELTIPADPMLAFKDLVVSEIIIPLDLIRINGEHHTIHLGDVGINAKMVENFSKEERRGWLGYAKHFFDSLDQAKQFPIKIESEGQVYEKMAYSVIIANTRMYGTGAIVNPEGNPHDGYFEIVIVHKLDWSGILGLGLTAIDESVIEKMKEYFEIYKVKSARILFEEDQMLQLDGEVIGNTKEINCEIMPAGVKYISTRDNTFVNDKIIL